MSALLPSTTLEAWQHAVGVHPVPDALWDFLDVVAHEHDGVRPETTLSSTITVRTGTTTISLWGRAWPQDWQQAIGQLLGALSDNFPFAVARQLKYQLSDTRRGVVFGPAVTLGSAAPRIAFGVRGLDGVDENRIPLSQIREMVDRPEMPLSWPDDLDDTGEASGWRLDMTAGAVEALYIELLADDDRGLDAVLLAPDGVERVRWVPAPSWEAVRAHLDGARPDWLRLQAVAALQPMRIAQTRDGHWLELCPAI